MARDLIIHCPGCNGAVLLKVDTGPNTHILIRKAIALKPLKV